LWPNVEKSYSKRANFRHRFVHGYGFMVTWDMVEEPLRQLPETVETLTTVWNAWLAPILFI